MQRDGDVVLSPWLRLFSGVVVLVLVGGSSLLLAPSLISKRWLWELTPFNGRFMGAIYLTELVGMIVLLIANRWSAGRLVLRLAFIFTAIVSVVSLVHVDLFALGRRATWGWFVLYVGSVLVTAYLLWRYRHLPPANPTPPSPVWRWILRAEAVLLSLYGLGLLFLPTPFARVWPWPVNPFHAQIYAAIFLTIAAGAFWLSRAAARLELLGSGLGQAALGLSAIAGLVVVDAAVHRINWAGWNTLAWVAAFVVLCLAGLGMVWQALKS